MRTTMWLDELFLSIQGESTDAGKPCVFVRLYGCNIGCSYCDQPQNNKTKTKISIHNLVAQVVRYGVKTVCITGGEPLLQWEVLYPAVLEMTSLGFEVSIETSGCIPIEADNYIRSFKYVMDIKCPSSGVQHKNVFDNLMHLQSNDEVKFVISDYKDYQYMLSVLRSYPTSAKILVSPCFNEDLKPLVGQELVSWILRDRMYQVRVQIQLHKILEVR